MFIDCPECNHRISSEAFICPSCGYPIKAMTVLPKPTKKYSKPRYKRLPNGYGSIRHLSGKRRHPYAAYPVTTEWTDDGVPKLPTAIGYYASYQDAFAALAEYNKSPYNTSARTATFADVFKFFKEDKKRAGKVAPGTLNRYEVSYNQLKSLHRRVFATLRKEDLQDALDALELGYSSVDQCRTLLTSMYRYAMQVDLVNKNWATFVTVSQEYDVENGEPFTEAEISTLWDHTDDVTVRFVLILVYTGFRISEALIVSDINLDESIFSGGLKSRAGRSRVVPIHSAIMPFVSEFKEVRSTLTAQGWRKRFYKAMKTLGMEYTADGKKHTPHDCRHTFSWLADKYEMDDLSKHLIMGHSLGADVEKSVYGHRTVEELRAEMEKICH